MKRARSRLVAAEREELLELVDDAAGTRVARRPLDEGERHREVQRARVGRELGERPLHRPRGRRAQELSRERGQRLGAGRHDRDRPPLAPGRRAAPERRGRARRARATTCRCPTGRARPGSGRLQLLEQPLDVGVAAEEELGVLLLEGVQAAIGGGDAVRLRGRPGVVEAPRSRRYERRDDSLSKPRRKSTHVRVRGRRKGVRVERLGQARKEHEEKAEAAILRGPVVSSDSSWRSQSTRSEGPMKTASREEASPARAPPASGPPARQAWSTQGSSPARASFSAIRSTTAHHGCCVRGRHRKESAKGRSPPAERRHRLTSCAGGIHEAKPRGTLAQGHERRRPGTTRRAGLASPAARLRSAATRLRPSCPAEEYRLPAPLRARAE